MGDRPACTAHGELIDAQRTVVEKPRGKRRVGERGHRWDQNISIDFDDITCAGPDWSQLAPIIAHCHDPVNTAAS
jgi:hypothetical protein